jgi:hypothetical protein
VSGCPLCGQPRGTGTLLDVAPDPPVPREGSLASVAIERWQWEEFAGQYRCPDCVIYEKLSNEQATP